MHQLSHSELAEIFAGAASSRRSFIELHRQKKDRPDTWFHQQARELAAFVQAEQDYRRAANRKST